LARLTIREQIKDLGDAKKNYPEYYELIKLNTCMLKTLIPIEDYLLNNDGKRIIDADIVRFKKESQEKLRVINVLDVEIFNKEQFREAIENIITCLQDRIGTRGLHNLMESLKKGEIKAIDGFRATLKEDSTWFREMGERFGLEDSLLLLIFSMPLRPYFEELARSLEGEFKDRWLQSKCPVCGRIPIVARVKERKRYMVCTYCGLEYLIDPFLCVYCGNNEPSDLGFLTFEDNPWFEISYCEKCKHYVKILFDDRIRKKKPKGLEDLLTQDLDKLALKKEFGLERA